MNQEAPNEHMQCTNAASIVWWLVAALSLYFLPFIAIAIDEKVLKTFWFSDHLPDWCGEVFRTIYPFYKLLGP